MAEIMCGLALALGACAGGGGGGDGGDSCTTDLECDDGFDCTLDGCRVDNTCRHDPIDGRCDMGLVCEVGRGCVSNASCMSDADCEDGIACTLNTCMVGGLCNYTALDELCSAPTTMCDLTMGCIVPPGCSSDAECDDGVACTNDSCTVGRTCSNTPLHELCDMAGGERCHETVGCYVPMPCTTAAECDDGDFCNGAEVCDPEFGCSPAEEPRVCDDSDDCTIDTCDTTADMCVFACDAGTAACMCPMTGPSCVGIFNISPVQSDRCACDTSCQVDYDLTQVTFTQLAGTLQATPTRAHFTMLGDTTAPVCPTFVAVAEVSGGTIDRYTLQGTFTDDDNFTGTFTAAYCDPTSGTCGFGFLGGCREGTVAVTGTRAP